MFVDRVISSHFGECFNVYIASLSHFGKFLMSIALYRPILVNVLLSISLYRPSLVSFIVYRFTLSHFGEFCCSAALYRPTLVSFIVDRVISSQFNGECFIVDRVVVPFW